MLMNYLNGGKFTRVWSPVLTDTVLLKKKVYMLRDSYNCSHFEKSLSNNYFSAITFHD